MGKPNVKYLVVHTAAADLSGVDAAVIDAWHRARGFDNIGYHFVIIDDRHPSLADGHIQAGRSLNKIGAHVLGMNSISLGICCVGHGDKRDFTEKQKDALAGLLANLASRYRVRLDRIIGHRDVNSLIDQGIVGDNYRTTKSCPGTKVSMPDIRARVGYRLRQAGAPAAGGRPPRRNPPPSELRLRAAVKLVERHVDQAPNAADAWRQFRNHPEVLRIMNLQPKDQA